MAGVSGAGEALPVNVTPIIDIIFCLIVFFLASYTPQTKRGELATYLPKDVGTNPVAAPVELQDPKRTLYVYISVNRESPTKTKILFGVNAPGTKSLSEVIAEITSTVKNLPESEIPPVNIQPEEDVPWEAVTQLISELKKPSTKIKEIQLGTARPRSKN
jgi:biopolymer transport protein ExbD